MRGPSLPAPSEITQKIMELHTEAPNFVGIDNGTDVGVVASLFLNTCITATGEPTNQIESHDQGHNLVQQNIETHNMNRVL